MSNNKEIYIILKHYQQLTVKTNPKDLKVFSYIKDVVIKETLQLVLVRLFVIIFTAKGGKYQKIIYNI